MDQHIAARLHALRSELAPNGDQPALVRAVASGEAPLGALAELAAQQQRIIVSDRRSLLLLATRCADRPLGAWFAGLADGESAALRTLPALAAACGLGPDETAARPPLPGCQAYPAYLAWLALNGRPAAVVVAMVANFTAWGGYCAAVADGLRRHYGFSDEACAFFDFFARPADALEEQAADALAPESPGGNDFATAREYGTLLQAYEQLFWESLAAARTVTGRAARPGR
ncbi:transcriptional regulator [Kitasatospora sp. A2-31]|uniref:transcriptional regulator n=1 Tax=Kitasatospora sp. A2-31 TaxID=2916414 RepID=UPI001EEB4AFB|nr:transcriptional regulator [Kitasatospora sp. A2-31]MCG6497726.1 transcriptional regulator [Kitasatospora sp. A2-31]